MLNRAFSLLEIKRVDDELRRITGTATTPAVDRIGDIIEPLGIKFSNPMPLLHHHKNDQPVGTVTFSTPTKDGVAFEAHLPKISEPGPLRDRVDTAWLEAKHGLLGGVSIGFRPVKGSSEPMKGGGIRFKEVEVFELSLVAIPANADCTIQTIKSIDTAQRAASGQPSPQRVVKLNSPGASGPSTAQEGAMTTIAEQITKLEAKRAASQARMEAVMQKTLDEERTTDATEAEEVDRHAADVQAIDKDLERLRLIEKVKANAARPVLKVETAAEGAETRGSSIIVRGQPKLPPGIEAARIWKAKMVARLDVRNVVDVATEMYGPDSNVVAAVKAPVPAGTTITGNWAADLVGAETGAVADFLEWQRAATILGRFGAGGVPALRSVMFYTPLITQTSGGAGYWVGESKAKPLTSFSFERTTLTPLKVANICVLTEENIRYSNPKSDTIVRNELAAALTERLDIDFISPSKTAVAGVSPASITNGAESIASAGDDADDIRLDIRSLFAKFTSANNPVTSGVWVMSSNTAAALAMMTNPLGQQEFGTMNTRGGTLGGMPVIASDHVSDIVVLINASDVYLADEGGITVDASREASLEMSDAPSSTSGTPTGASLVSMWQTNSVALRAERTINWARRRAQSVAYLTGVSWGGEVNTA